MNALVDLPFPWDVRPVPSDAPERVEDAAERLCIGQRALQRGASATGHRGVARLAFALPMREWDAIAARVVDERRKAR